MYLGYFDPDKKKPTEQKIRDAAMRYEAKWQIPARIALVHPSQVVDMLTIEVRAASHIPVNTFFVGEDDA